MEWLAAHGFVIAFWATIFWGSIQLLDRGNVKNAFWVAVVWGAVYDFSHWTMLPDMIYLAAWLVFLLRLVTWHYGLSLLGAVIVTAATVLAPYLIMPQIVKFVGDSALRDALVLYGFPIVVFGTWLVTSLRKRASASANAPAPGEGDAVPLARVARWGRKRAAKQAAEAATPVVAAPAAPLLAPEPTPPHLAATVGPGF
jgi:hypothetical protein